MTYLSRRDFLIEVQKGNVPGHSIVHKFGRSDAVGTSFVHVDMLGGTTFFLNAATQIRVKAGDVADDAAGVGAQEITVQGIDTSLAEVSVVLATAGVSASLNSAESLWRPYRAWVSACGTYGGSNIADVVIENSAGTQDLVKIEAGEGQTEWSGLSIPQNVSGYLLSAFLTVDATKAADFAFYQRQDFNDTAVPVAAKRLVRRWTGIEGELDWRPRSPIPFNALTDLWCEAKTATGTAEVTADFEVLLVDD